MGTKASEKGLTLKFLRSDGTEGRRQSVFGEFAFFFSTPRPIAIGSHNPIYGSQDWLTDIIVVDNPVKLIDLPPSQAQVAATSCSSPHVLLRWDVGTSQGREDGSLTICDGKNVSATHVFAEEILVLPAGTIMDENHPLFEKWKQGALFVI